MKKCVLFLLLLLMIGGGNVWAQGSSTQSSFKFYGTSDYNFTPGTEDNSSVSNLAFTIGATGASWTNTSRTYSRSYGEETISYTRSVKANNSVSLSSGVPTSGTFIVFKPTRNGTISVDLFWNTYNKHIDAYDSTDPTTAIATQSVGSTKESQTFTFSVVQGHTYYVYPSGGTTGLELFGFSFTAASEENTLMISVEDMRYESGYTGSNLARTIADFGFEFNGNVVSNENNGTYSLVVNNSGTITITSNSSAKITQVALYCWEPSSTAARGGFTFQTTVGTAGYFYYVNQSGTNSVTFTNGASDGDVNIYSIWISTDIGMGNTKQNVTWSFSPSVGSTTINKTDFSISSLITSPTAFRADSYSVTDDGDTGTTYNTYHANTHMAAVNTGSSNGVATIQAAFAGNNFFNAATPATYKLVVTGEGKTTWDFTVSEEIDTLNLKADGTNWTYNSTDKYYNSGELPTSAALTANGVPLLYADGLMFSGNIQIYPDNCIRLTNENRTITIPNVASGKYVAVTFRSTNNSDSRGFTASGTSGASGTYETVAQKTVYIATTDAGSFVLTSNSGLEILRIAIVDEVPHEAMFTMTTPATTTDVSTSTDIVLTADRDIEVVDGENTVNLTVNGTSVAFTFNSSNNTLTCTNATLTAAIGALADGTSYTIALLADVVQVNGGAMNSAQNFAFVTAETAVGLTPEYSRLWKFSEFETSSITTTVLENNMELVGTSSLDMSINGSSKTYEGERYTSRLQFKGAGSTTGRYIHFKVAPNTRIEVYGVSAKSGETRNLYIATGTFDNKVVTQEFSSDVATAAYDYTGSDATDVYVYAASAVNIYGVRVTSSRAALTRFSPKGNQYTTLDKNNGRTQWPPYYVLYTPTQANIQANELSITSSDPTVLDVSSVTYDLSTSGQIGINGMAMGEGGTATITLNYSGNATYSPTSTYFVLTVDAPGQFRVEVADQQIQRGQRTIVTPVITDKNGNQLGIRNDGGTYSTFILGEDDDVPDYSQYFAFTYTAGEGTGENYNYINVDGSGNVTTRTGENYAAVGATRVINVTGTVKSEYASLFTNSSISGSGTMTIVAPAERLELEFFFDAACTDAHKIVQGTDNRVEGSTGIFGDSGTFPDGFPNGRMIYAKPLNEGDEIWFSFAKNKAASDLTSEHKIDKNKAIFQYRRGIPIFIDETLVEDDYISVNAVAMYKNESGKWQLRGGVAKMKFLIVSHDRPAQPTYDPVSPDEDDSKNDNNHKIMNTSQNVVAYGEGASKTTTGRGNLVYGKFSTGSIYKTFELINEANVQLGINSVPVVSTEVNKRRFTAVQIRTEAAGEDYISTQTYTEYFYLYDTRLALTPSGNQYINVRTSTTAPTTNVTWYNKATPGWQNAETQTVTFSIADRNGASDATINTETGVVTAGNQTGWVRVKASFAGTYPEGENHGGDGHDGEPQYNSYLDASEANFYVYISDPTQEEPEITPPTRKFTSTQAFRVKAPLNWVVRYTTDGKEPSPTNGTLLNKNSYVEGEVSATTTVKAIAYNSDNTELVSRIVSETYTKVDPLPDPIFNPDGVPSPYYYNTNTLVVQIACAYAGSVIYYTLDGSTPEIDAEGTYKYSGLEKVTIAGNVAIKAIAYDPVNDIYSNVVTSNYIYSTEMMKPYFQVSDDGGTTWYGLESEGATTLTANGDKWYGGEAIEITPNHQIRIVDPNPVKGTTFFTLDGSVPSANGTALIYRTPFTTPKTITGKAITFLDEASSPVASATFVIDSSRYPVWEAVYETLSQEGGVYGIRKADGYVISTNKDLNVQNTGSKVNLNSISSTSGGNASYTYAQADITATFGGYSLDNWTQMTIADDAIGNPLGNVGDFTIKSVDNAKDELTNNCNHAYFFRADGKTAGDTPTLHEKTFKVPANGTYVRFEPEKDGDLSIWVLQQGAVHYEDDKYFIPNYIRLKPVYLVDEQGNSIQVKKVNGIDQMWSTARLSAKWTTLREVAADNNGAGGWKDYDSEGKGDIQYLCLTTTSGHAVGDLVTTQPSGTENIDWKKMENKGPNRAESKYIFERFENYLTTKNINIGDNIEPIAIHIGNSISLNNGKFVDDSNDGTGYVLASGGYAKYTFPVKAGKTYFFMGNNTKIGIRGFQFVPKETEERGTLTIEETSTSAVADGNKDKPLDVTLTRSFKAGTWATLVLPFSVSATEVEKVFGAKTDILHFDGISGAGNNVLLLKRHWYKMIVAGTPILIKPTKDVDIVNPTFEGVTIETTSLATPETLGSADQDYTMMGTYVKSEGALHQYDYYISTSTGNFTRNTGSAVDVPGTYAWLRAKDGVQAKLSSVMMASAFEEGGTTTDIDVVQIMEALTGGGTATGVYNLRGQKVSESLLNDLPKGVYVVNGKKVVID